MSATDKPWDRRKGETSMGYGRFVAFLNLGSERTLKRLSDSHNWGHSSLLRLSALNDWMDRSAAYDQAEFDKSLANRQSARERVRQRFINRANEYAQIIEEIAQGELRIRRDSAGNPVPGQTTRDLVPIVKASTRLQAAIKGLELAGITTPRRVEIATQDSQAADIHARNTLRTLNIEQLRVLKEGLQGMEGETTGEGEKAEENPLRVH